MGFIVRQSCYLLILRTGLESYISIEASADVPRAGENFTLTCTAFSDGPTQLIWIDENGLQPPISVTHALAAR